MAAGSAITSASPCARRACPRWSRERHRRRATRIKRRSSGGAEPGPAERAGARQRASATVATDSSPAPKTREIARAVSLVILLNRARFGPMRTVGPPTTRAGSHWASPPKEGRGEPGRALRQLVSGHRESQAPDLREVLLQRGAIGDGVPRHRLELYRPEGFPLVR